MTARGVTLCFALALGLVACSDDPDETSTPSTEETSSSTSTVPERPVSTTTTAFDPASVEGAVEAAYLRSWDVYADAVYDLELDEEALEAVYAEDHLETKRSEIERRIKNGEAALVRVEHNYSIDVLDEATVLVVDQYRNHQVLIDPETKEPIEEDPNEVVADAVTLKRIGGQWRVTFVEEFAST